MTEEETIMINLWHPCREIDVWYTKTDADREAAVSQGYVSLKDMRLRVICYEGLWKRLDEQYAYSENLERIIKEGD